MRRRVGSALRAPSVLMSVAVDMWFNNILLIHILNYYVTFFA